MNGKNKCKILKEIRRRIASANDIAYVTSECKFQGNCTGTCPKCEAEVRFLEEELRKRQQTGKAVAVAGIAAALVVSVAGCSTAVAETISTNQESTTASSTTFPDDEVTAGVPVFSSSEEIWMGEPSPPPPEDDTVEMGNMLPPEEDPQIMGDMVEDPMEMGEVPEE